MYEYIWHLHKTLLKLAPVIFYLVLPLNTKFKLVKGNDLGYNLYVYASCPYNSLGKLVANCSNNDLYREPLFVFTAAHCHVCVYKYYV